MYNITMVLFRKWEAAVATNLSLVTSAVEEGLKLRYERIKPQQLTAVESNALKIIGGISTPATVCSW